MQNENLKKGLPYGIIMVILVGIQPIIANTRPTELDSYIFAAMTCIIQALIFLPVMIIERNKFKSVKKTNPGENDELHSLLHGWKSHKPLLIYIGFNFAAAQFLFYTGFLLAGSINGALAQKTTVIFGLLFGYLINKEPVKKTQVLFSLILLFGVGIAITEGRFDLLAFNIGVLIMFVTTTLWMLAHSLTKPMLDKKDSTPTQLVFIRNGLSGIILMSTYFLFFSFENFGCILDPTNSLYYIIMGVVYGIDLFCWYKLLSFIGISKASVIASPTPIVTAFFASFLGEIFTIFHLIGLIIVIISIYVIVREKEKENSIEV